MLKLLGILWNSFRMALQELRVNKLRTFLSLFGITIGIFCIIGVLAAVNSLENKVQSDVKTLGSNTIYIDKWQYGGGPDYPWWKYYTRPTPKYDEVKFIKEKSTLASYVAYFNSNNATLVFDNSQLSNVSVYCITEDFNKIQTFGIAYGRYFSETEFMRGTAVCVIGYKNAELLFGEAQQAVGKTISMNGKHVQIVGVIEKQGSSLIGSGFDYDQCLMLTYRYFASVWNTNDENNGQPFIMVNGKTNVPTSALIDELRGIMRQQRKLSPTTEDNFALNDVNSFSEQVGSFFGSVNIGGWVIAGLSLIVGGFGVANIMFVTVRERTSQIGLKKAIGAKSRTILTEFLLESAFLCILGGTFGLLLVYILTLILSSVLPFPIFIAPHIILIAFSVCVVLGVLSGIIPARTAAKMNPVEAIRSR
ncbi:FtsX-like permease family protein [Ilyomonas limi]|uniref:FtsX-like permease family protein n=1 Tax=Ilyomonas limi TaxID=2575867 RepID=A0A4U3KT80_9BACT|nr:ABC transporter permease [Ilyomonas limi]TKK65522.1 FtsX-like permease family protein [Ilyomonas limi]